MNSPAAKTDLIKERKERDAFETWVLAPPFELSCARFPDDENSSWPGDYIDYTTHIAWCAWKAAIALRG